MDLLRYRFEAESLFSPPVSYHAFKLRCTPMETSFQHLLDHRVSISPACRLLEATDCFGNRIHYGSISNPHASFHMVSEGLVECADHSDRQEQAGDLFLYPTRLTSCNTGMRHLARTTCRQPLRPTATALMHAVHEYLQYEKYVTHNATTAEWVFDNRKGVCQDYTHLMIALCRAAGLHARYVAGLIIGEGETHAWVEVYEAGCWRGFDPTYDRVVTTDYIKLAQGRDASDCPLNRGRFYQWTTELFSVHTKVNKTEP